ncbi:MAG: SDR family NAD(P)-dependent oxidoreductase [Bacillota bacterium]
MIKTILLTGATDGIGLLTAEILATEGHALLLHGRNEEKLRAVKEKLSAVNPSAKVETYKADLSVFAEVKAMADEILKNHDSIDGIINNAGVFVVETDEVMTVDGVDIRFAVNTIAPYILTKKLLPIVAENGRIVNLSSAAQAPVNLEKIQNQKPFFHDEAYAQSKLAITMWSMSLADSSEVKKKNIVVVAVNPKSFLGSKMVKTAYGKEGYDLKIGADILIEAMCSEKFADANGKYYDNDTCRFAKPHSYALIETHRNVLMEYLNMF